MNIKIKRPLWLKCPKWFTRRWQILVALVILFFVVRAIVNHNRQSFREEREYARLEHCIDPIWYENFMLLFPESKHYDEVKRRYEQLKVDQIAFGREAAHGTKADILAYLQSHPNTPFRYVCERRVDTLDYQFADSLHTVESWNDYLAEHPNGLFMEQALRGLQKAELVVVTDEDRQQASRVLNAFLDGLNNGNPAALDAYVTDNMRSFCGLEQPGTVDVISQFQAQVRPSDATTFRLSAVSVSLNKQLVKNTEEVYYNVQASLQGLIGRANADTLAVGNYYLSGSMTTGYKFSALKIESVGE